jgi:uncharacterized delta-60 repeat protein
MQKFRQFIAIIVLHTILFSLGTSSLNAVEEEIYSLDHLPFAEISDTVQDTLVPAPYQATEDDRRDMLDGDSFLQSKTESEQPMQIHFVYSGSEEVRTLLAEKRIFDTKGFSEEDPSRVFFQVPDFFLQPQMAWSNFFLSGSFGNSVAPLSDRWGDWMGDEELWIDESLIEPVPQFIGRSYRLEKKARKTTKLQNLKNPIHFEIASGTEVRTANGEIIDMANIDFTDMQPGQSLKAKKKHEQKLNHRWVETKGLSQISLQWFEFGIPWVHLIFSKPVKIRLEIPEVTDGNTFDLLTMHSGDSDFHTWGLSADPSTLCNSDGTATLPVTTATVKNGKVVFYTCGASTFALWYVPKTDYPNNTVWTVSSQSDGKTYIGWQFTAVGTWVYTRFARLTKESFLDTTFSDPNVNNTVYASVIQSDGKIIIGWAFTTVGWVARNYLARLNTDGTLDPTWNPNLNNQVRAILIQPDGKVLIWGQFTTVGWVARNRIARLNTDGTLDVAFNPNSNNIVYTLALESDNQILVGWTFTNIVATARNRIARLNTDGTIDATFNPNANNTVWDIELFTDGTIAIGGQFTTIGGTGRNRIAKVSAAWVLDATWNPNVAGWATPIVYSLLPLSDNSLIFGWAYTTVTGTARNRIAKVSAAGVLDTTFNPNANGNIQILTSKTDGTIALGWAFTTVSWFAQSRYAELRGNFLDTEYNLGMNGTVWTVAPSLADTSVIIAGQFTTINTSPMVRVAKVNTGWFLETTFKNPNINNTVYASAIQTDGKIIIGWAFTTASGTARNYLARLNTDGTLDATWNPNPNNQVRAIIIQPDGKVLIWGQFTTVGWVGRNRIARINADGTLDAAFNPNSNNIVYTLALEPDNQILVGGTFTNIAATARNRVARLNANGTIDAAFNPNSNNTIWDIELFSDGTIALGWAFTTIGWTARNNIAKVSALGALDLTWNPNANGIVYALLPLPDNSLIFGWAFTTVTAVARNRIARVSALWVLDTTINPNANNTVYALKRDLDGNILVGWAFTTMSAKAVPYFTWIGMNTDTSPPTILSNSVASGSLVPKGTFPITLGYTDTGTAINPSSLIGRIYQWNATGATWFTSNLAWSYLSITSATTSTGVFQVNNLPYGRYRFDFLISDILGNTRTVSYTYYVDEIEWTVSTPLYPIGTIPNGSDTFGTGEILLTVRTIGAGFNLSLLRNADMSYSGETITVYDGTHGWWYDKDIGSGYASTLTAHGTTQTLVTTPKSIDANGFKNTFVYRVKFWMNPNANALAGMYQGSVNFGINLTY